MITIHTEKPIALDSPDHLRPVGTARDNSVHPEFNRRLYEIVPAEQVRLLDLGCAGGGFVKSILDDGGFAVGIEGSDYSRIRQRAEWATIPDSLFCADLTEPFHLLDDAGSFTTFNVFTAWEFLEHISQSGLPGVMENVHLHAEESARPALFLGSISPLPYVEKGVAIHQTVRPRDWWLRYLKSEGFTHRPDLEAHFADEWVRGPRSAHRSRIPSSSR